MQKKPHLSYPKKFLWGASVSAHQVEGGQKNQWSQWEDDQAKTLAAQAPYQWGDIENWNDIKAQATQSSNYLSGRAVDHYNQFELDFDIIKKLNMNAFRFSIEWSKLEPEEGTWSAEAVAYYKAYIDALRQRGIEPIVTLFHFTLPIWFAEAGGFTKRKNVEYFVRYAERIVEELGASVKYIITINEPEVYANESYRAGNWPPNRTSKRDFYNIMLNLARAHNKTADALHEKNRRFKVSIAANICHTYAGDDALLSRKTASVMQYEQSDYFLKKVIKKCDFLGVNYYFSNRVYGYRVHNPEKNVSDLGWDMTPADIQFVLERTFEKYKLPIIVTENGLASSDDERRKWWLSETLLAMQKAMDNGVRLDGYLHWSLLDNFEWDKGYWPQFGLVAVDRSTMKRRVKPSAIWYSKIIKHLRSTQ